MVLKIVSMFQYKTKRREKQIRQQRIVNDSYQGGSRRWMVLKSSVLFFSLKSKTFRKINRPNLQVTVNILITNETYSMMNSWQTLSLSCQGIQMGTLTLNVQLNILMQVH